ncbi:protein prenyltransferase alpha subunit repeat-containing protein 1-like [Saccoglossus kowalevskii]|uniref:Protein prenyltransferase alpha subunit repeat-containing protein 1-like n=1 Tax=Saccoglossus kowalevskii TaxID=10224 RepID=A0ABM0GJH4_SACKO|nr:PREDICTED: protein prenyltransferase alpha subunit repeat-containing protein 1-like [Saccoglossus kowalevskii]
MADDERGRRILSDLSLAFTRDPSIDEVGFIPCPEALQNRSPIILQEHKLGLESWCISLLYQYAYNELLQAREKTVRLVPSDLIGCTRAVLIINPECYTVWNMRKELVCSHKLDIAADLKFNGLIFTRQPKSPETFAHRKWLLVQLRQRLQETKDMIDAKDSARNHDENGRHVVGNHRGKEDVVISDSIVENEFKVCTLAAEHYSNNYSAWSHRIWVLQNLAVCDGRTISSELSKTVTLVSMHISDHSGFHYRQFLIQQIGKLNQRGLDSILQQELLLISDLIDNYPGHESIWYHRRFVFHMWHHLQTPKQTNGKYENSVHTPKQTGDDIKSTRQAACLVFDITDNQEEDSFPTNPCEKKFRADESCKVQLGVQEMIASEIEFIEKCLKSVYPSDYPSQYRCAHAYKKWLQFFYK